LNSIGNRSTGARRCSVEFGIVAGRRQRWDAGRLAAQAGTRSPFDDRGRDALPDYPIRVNATRAEMRRFGADERRLLLCGYGQAAAPEATQT
jgi:hypothetical protein